MLTIKNLSAGYGKVQVLHGISLDVPKGRVVTLIGSNGAGKTTTMRAVSGMIKPSGGEITLNERRIDGLESYHIARQGLAHSPEGRRVFATMTVTDNLRLGAFPRYTGERPKGDIAGDLERALELFPRLKERRLQLAGTLSGGEQQMLAMARAVDDEARAGTRANLLKALDAAAHPEVVVRTLQQFGEGPRRAVEAEISLHGVTRRQWFVVDVDGRHARGEVVIRQSDFGIQPFAVLGGLLAVQDALVVQFELSRPGA